MRTEAQPRDPQSDAKARTKKRRVSTSDNESDEDKDKDRKATVKPKKKQRHDSGGGAAGGVTEQQLKVAVADAMKQAVAAAVKAMQEGQADEHKRQQIERKRVALYEKKVNDQLERLAKAQSDTSKQVSSCALVGL